MTRCKHYVSPLDSDVCKAGVKYNDVNRGVPFEHRACFRPFATNCALQDWPTPADIAAEDEAVAVMLRQFLSDLEADICPHCQAPITHKRQVGRCVYAEPCGHRLYQGRL